MIFPAGDTVLPAGMSRLKIPSNGLNRNGRRRYIKANAPLIRYDLIRSSHYLSKFAVFDSTGRVTAEYAGEHVIVAAGLLSIRTGTMRPVRSAMCWRRILPAVRRTMSFTRRRLRLIGNHPKRPFVLV